jgi:hypothetical protein
MLSFNALFSEDTNCYPEANFCYNDFIILIKTCQNKKYIIFFRIMLEITLCLGFF